MRAKRARNFEKKKICTAVENSATLAGWASQEKQKMPYTGYRHQNCSEVTFCTYVTSTTRHAWENGTRRQERKQGEVLEKVAKFHAEASKKKSWTGSQNVRMTLWKRSGRED